MLLPAHDLAASPNNATQNGAVAATSHLIFGYCGKVWMCGKVCFLDISIDARTLYTIHLTL